MPENVTNFQVFEGDKHILEFVTSPYVFAFQIIDEVETEEEELDIEGTINMKTNTIPRGMVQLQRIYDLDHIRDHDQQTKKGSIDSECDAHNLGTAKNVKNVFINKFYTLEEKKEIIEYLHTYHDVISWGYKDIKTYDTSIITHTIPLKPYASTTSNKCIIRTHYF